MSAEKTLDILELFEDHKIQWTVPQLAKQLNQPQSSVYRHLRLLKDRGYVMESGDGYKLGYRFLKFARIVREDLDLVTIAKSPMRQLTQHTGETSILLIRSHYFAVCLEAIPSSLPIKVSSAQGEIVPLYGGASSKPLLIDLDDEFMEHLFAQPFMQQRTQGMNITLQSLQKDIREIRRQGYAHSDGEIDDGVIAFGVPIRNSENEIIASLSIAGPRERMIQKSKQELIQKLQHSAKLIGSYL